jgi:hypothetical protein
MTKSKLCLGTFIPIFLSLFFLIQSDLNGQKEISKDWKVTKELQHPYLYFSAEDVPNILKRIEASKENSEIMDALRMTTNRLLYTPVGSPPPQSKNPRYDGDGKFNSWISNLRHSMLELAFMYQMTNDQKYADKAFEFAEALCTLPLWNIKAHEFPIIYDRVWPWNALNNDDQVVFNFDIRTGDVATEMGIAYDWLYTGLSKAQRDQMRGAMLEKAILIARNNYDYHWWATSYKCNWNTICFSGLGVSSMALLTEDPSLIDVVIETYKRTTLFLNELGDDGGWQEGRGYWAYGMRASIFFMDAMDRLSDGEYSLYEHPKLQKYPVDFALYGLTGYFGDGTGKVVGSTHLINKLTEKTGNTDAAWYRENMMNQGKEIFDILWPVPDVEPVKPKVASRHFSTIDWAFMRSDFKNPDNVTVACKAGYNDDPHHGHLDIGQFSVYWKNQYFITDLGHGDYFYDEKYFNEARWTYPPANSAGHNLVYVNGEQQISAKLKNQPWKEGIGGKILDFRASEEMDYTLMDPTNAYPKKEMQGWRRHIVLLKPDIVLVLDEVKSKVGSEIEARFHPGVEMEVYEDLTILIGEKGQQMAIIPTETDAAMEAGRHAYLPVRKEAKLAWIPYSSSIKKASEDHTIIGHLVLPVDNLEHARTLKKGLKISIGPNASSKLLTFKYGGKDFKLIFEQTKEGLVLQK